jgi:hypothetical protein
LRLIAIKLKDVADLIFGYMHRQVIKSLELSQCDRVLKVRQAAIMAKQQWQQVKFITAELDQRKRNEELRGLSPEDLIRARTGYNDLEDVRQSILQDVEGGGASPNKRVMRPMTAEANEMKRSVSQ